MRILIGMVIGVAVSAVTLLLFAHFGGRWPTGAGPTANTATAVPAWPWDKAWSWSFPAPPAGADGDWVALRIREKSVPTSATTVAVMPFTASAMKRAEADREFGTGRTGRFAGEPPLSGTGTATAQLIDLSEAGATSSKPGQNLRVLAKLALGGGTTKLGGDDVYLPAGHFAGETVRQGPQEWVNGEMYLMTFYVQGDSRRYQYDVLLERTGDR